MCEQVTKRWSPGLERRCARCDFFVKVRRDGLIRRHAAGYPVKFGFPDAGRSFVSMTRCLGSGWPPMRAQDREMAARDRQAEEEMLRAATEMRVCG